MDSLPPFLHKEYNYTLQRRNPDFQQKQLELWSNYVMEWTRQNSNNLDVRDLHKQVGVNSELNRMISEEDFDSIVEYMVEKDYARLEDGQLYVYAISIQDIADQLYDWAEDRGVVDQAEFSLIDELYETSGRGFPDEFKEAPPSIKDMIMNYLERSGKVTLNEFEGD